MLVAIHAFENTYGGLHGIERHHIIEVENLEEAEEYAEEESRDIIESYGEFMENFSENAEADGLEEGMEDYDDYIEECIQENIGFQIWEVIDKYADIKTMRKDFYNNREKFVKEHCKEME